MLTIQNLHKSYQVGKTSYEVLKGISFDVNDGEFVAVMGPSGSGKTTLLNCISCYIPFNNGSILLGDTNLKNLNEDKLAKVRNQKLVRENIMLPRMISGKTDSSMEETADRLCEVFGIAQIKNKFPSDISGGEKQRTAVARALINNPLLILADEPTGNLDSKSSRAVIDSFLQAKNRLGATIFMVTHDSFAASFCDRVIILRDGMVWKVLSNNGNRHLDRSHFQDELLLAIKEMSGDNE